MSSEAGLRKRNKDKKKKKGSTGDISSPGLLREAPQTKLIIDETIHVQKDASVGGNLCTKLIFVVFLVVLGGLMFYALSDFSFGKANNEDDIETVPWYSSLLNLDLFSSNEPSKKIEEIVPDDVQPQASYLDILWQLYPFGGSESPPEVSPEPDTLEDSLNEKDAREDEEFAPEENEDDDQDKEDDTNTNLDNTAEDDDLDEGNDDIQRSYNNENSKESEESTGNSEEESPNESEELDRRDSRYNYYKNDDAEKKYNYRDDDLNDSSERRNDEDDQSVDQNKLNNSEEDTSKENYFKSDDSSDEKYDSSDDVKPIDHSSEEVEHSDIPEEPPKEEPKVEQETPSGNLITKLTVGVALIFVAYSVIIRKWNNYADLVLDEVDAVLRNQAEDQNENDIQPILDTVQDLIEDQLDYHERKEENKTLQEYLETPTESESEHSEDSEGNIPLDTEESVTQSETDENEVFESNRNFNDYARAYDRANITNQYDWRHREELDDADDDVDRGRISSALEKYEKILKTEPSSVRAKYGIAKCLDKRAEQQKSNQLLAKVIQTYIDAIHMPNVPKTLVKLMAERVINRMRFKGDYTSCVSLLKSLIERFPRDVGYHNELVVTYLILNRMSEAKNLLEDMLRKWPDNGLALVNYGFVLKMNGDLEKAVKFLYKGIESYENGTQDSRFYFHLGDALQKLYRKDEAMQVYQLAVKKGLFPSKYQRSLYNVNRLTAKPWWTIEETYETFFKNLIANWRLIRDEASDVLKYEKNTAFREESEQLRETGDWRQLEIYSRGVQKPDCKRVPVTCRIISNFPSAAGCRRGQVKFSVIEPGTHVWPHCGPTNCRLRAHLGLIVPSNVTIRVADETRSWKEGEILIFDDSFEHEIWHNGTSTRLILIVDVWHPELSAQERRSLVAI